MGGVTLPNAPDVPFSHGNVWVTETGPDSAWVASGAHMMDILGAASLNLAANSRRHGPGFWSLVAIGQPPIGLAATADDSDSDGLPFEQVQAFSKPATVTVVFCDVDVPRVPRRTMCAWMCQAVDDNHFGDVHVRWATMEAEKAEKRYGKCVVPGTLIYDPGADSLYELKFTAVPGMVLNCPTIQPKTGPKFLDPKMLTCCEMRWQEDESLEKRHWKYRDAQKGNFPHLGHGSGYA
ncbi:hypothetical protein B0H13DRAFT_1873841 [Mycena leptocephala]|nr:hypothetical protein B0H13DRAFT_1873841 [Mycena leptocephala]